MSGITHLVETHKRFKNFSSGGRVRYHCCSDISGLHNLQKVLMESKSKLLYGMTAVFVGTELGNGEGYCNRRNFKCL